MKNRFYLYSRRVAIALLLAMLAAGCLSRANEPSPSSTTTAAPVPTVPEAPVPKPTAATALSPTKVPIPEAEPVSQEGLLYQDDFTKLDSGWDQLAFDNSYIGYHEPGYYHVEVHVPNSKELVPVPDQTFTDFTVEVEVFADADLSAADGDYTYGLVFRRSGDLYYAFTLSPNAKQWTVIKNSLSGPEILQDGSEESIGGVGVADVLRVDARGEDFFFHINGEPVTRVRDDGYAGGEVGFYVQTLDNTKAHIHFDAIVIRQVEAPQLLCDVIVHSVNLRSGPSTDFRILTALLLGDQFEPLGRTQDGLWIQARVEDSDQVGWVANDGAYSACNMPIEDLPVSEP